LNVSFIISIFSLLKETDLRPLTHQQRLHLINSEQLYENYGSALKRARSYAYGMR